MNNRERDRKIAYEKAFCEFLGKHKNRFATEKIIDLFELLKKEFQTSTDIDTTVPIIANILEKELGYTDWEITEERDENGNWYVGANFI